VGMIGVIVVLRSSFGFGGLGSDEAEVWFAPKIGGGV
jgi:hypothetical protein